MGRSNKNDSANAYREKISAERLRAVTHFIHDWLFTVPPAEGQGKLGDANAPRLLE
jgi:hypothetical protein